MAGKNSLQKSLNCKMTAPLHLVTRSRISAQEDEFYQCSGQWPVQDWRRPYGKSPWMYNMRLPESVYSKGENTMTSQNENKKELNASQAGTVTLGDVTISRMGFGTMQLPGPGVWGEPRDPQEARRVLRRAVELGINYLDTASYYGPLVSDRLIVEVLYPYPAGLIIGTKVGGWRGSDKSWIAETRPEQLKTSVEDNLDRLRLEQLPLVHLRYAEQAGVPFEDSLGAMIELRQAGKIRHIGLSGVTLEQLTAAQKLVPIASVQNLYNLVDRHDENILDYCTQQGIPFMPFFPSLWAVWDAG